jgi:hypothetical protein
MILDHVDVDLGQRDLAVSAVEGVVQGRAAGCFVSGQALISERSPGSSPPGYSGAGSRRRLMLLMQYRWSVGTS